MKLTTVASLAEINEADWNNLVDSDNPFIQYDFLHALEKHNCLEPWGWQPHHVTVYDDNDLVGASPAYIKNNSYGEFVFDWAWADAYQRNGLEYYPKLVVAVPFTPASAQRLLTSPDSDASCVRQLLIRGAATIAEKASLSTVHWLFCTEDEHRELANAGMLLRSGVQFHWHNNDYEDFDHFLSRLSSKKRKNIRRERKKVADSNIEITVTAGDELDERQWQILYDFYRITFLKKSGTPTLSLEFFQAMKHRLVAVLASHEHRVVAGAICFTGNDTFYGRHWGCYEDYDCLHFEVCYYACIEYCIRHKLKCFEPGAQGEHKIARGFMPTRTWSAHWVGHDKFREAIGRHLQHEAIAMGDYYQQLIASQPYRGL